MSGPQVLEYSDYRQFLKDVYLYRKSLNKPYSYRHFAEELGLKPTNYLHLVISGKRNLSLEKLEVINENLFKKEADQKFMYHLVRLNHLGDDPKTDKHQKEISRLAGQHNSVLGDDHEAFFQNWYIPILKEIVSLKGFVSNLNWISKKIQPTVDEDLIKESLNILQRLGFIELKNGRWSQLKEHVSTLPEVTSNVIMDYHQEMLDLSKTALLQIEAGQRDFSAMTMSVSADQLDMVKEELAEFRDRLQRKLDASSSKATDVVQLNMQLFPVTNQKNK